jgi:hypothetical protein
VTSTRSVSNLNSNIKDLSTPLYRLKRDKEAREEAKRLQAQVKQQPSGTAKSGGFGGINIDDILKMQPKLPSLITEESKGDQSNPASGIGCPNCATGGRRELSDLALSSFVIEISIMPKAKEVTYDREHQCDLMPYDLEIGKRGGVQP